MRDLEQAARDLALRLRLKYASRGDLVSLSETLSSRVDAQEKAQLDFLANALQSFRNKTPSLEPKSFLRCCNELSQNLPQPRFALDFLAYLTALAGLICFGISTKVVPGGFGLACLVAALLIPLYYLNKGRHHSLVFTVVASPVLLGLSQIDFQPFAIYAWLLLCLAGILYSGPFATRSRNLLLSWNAVGLLICFFGGTSVGVLITGVAIILLGFRQV